ncbi:MAG: TIGR00266 family protein [Roseiflexaceae bacterium]|nr:TIGR00266 family protein [Roseiflexaceae bacterium]
MEYKIVGTIMQAVIMELDPGETVFSESGSLAWMSGNIVMNTTGRGGLGGMFKRAISGESLFMVEYTAQSGKALISFAADFPGKIVPVHLSPGQQIIAQKDAFLCGEKTLTTDIHFKRNLGTGLFGGEGFILQKFTGPGVAFVSLDGEIVEYTLEPGQLMKCDTGCVAMFEPTVSYDVEMVKGFKNVLFGGEGLFLSTLRGPGRVWLQTMPMMNLAKAIAPFLPASGGGGGNSGGLGSLFNE